MAKIRRVDFSPDEWLGGTIPLDNACRGLYITACALIYSHGGPIHRDDLKAAVRDHGHAFNRQLGTLLTLGKLTDEDGLLSNKRCVNELQMADKRSANASQNADKRWANDRQKDGENSETNELDDEPALQGRNANHQPSTINHHLKRRAGARDASLNGGAERGAKPYLNGHSQLPPEAPWQARITSFQKSQFWLPDWGPSPIEPNCFVPNDVLKSFGYA